MMKRLATILMAVAASLAWSGTVRMGALSTDTTVETLGEGAAAVQLVSKAKIDSMIEALSVGSDGTWLELNGSTGIIYQIVREVGYEGGNDKLIVTGVSEDFSGYMIPSNPVGITFTLIGNLPTYDFYGIDINSIYGVRVYKTGLQVSMIGQSNPLFSWNASSEDPMVAPFLLSGSSAASHGSITLDWYGIKTNAYQIAITDDLPDLSGYATTGDVAAVSNWVESIRGVHADIATNVVYHVVVSNGHWLIREVQ